MEDLLHVLYSVYTRPVVAEYVKSLIGQGAEAQESLRLHMTLTGCCACLIHVGERRDKLTAVRRDAFEQLLSDGRLQHSLTVFAVGVKGVDDPALLLDNLEGHASTVAALDERYTRLLADCGCGS